MPLAAMALAVMSPAMPLAVIALAVIALAVIALAAMPVPGVLTLPVLTLPVLASPVLTLPVLLRPALVLAALWVLASSGVPSAFSSSSGPTVRVPLKEGVPGLPPIAEVAPSVPGKLFGVPADCVGADALWAVMPIAAMTPAKAASLEPGTDWFWPA